MAKKKETVPYNTDTVSPFGSRATPPVHIAFSPPERAILAECIGDWGLSGEGVRRAAQRITAASSVIRAVGSASPMSAATRHWET